MHCESWTVELVGGPHDGETRSLRRGDRALLIERDGARGSYQRRDDPSAFEWAGWGKYAVADEEG